MSKIPENLLYTKEHEWVKIKDGVVTIGITDYAQDQLGDIVFVELPEVGDEVTQLEEMGVVESVKTASDMFAPLSGEIVGVNKFLMQEVDGEDNEDFHPEYVNQDPYVGGWICKIKISDESELEGLLSPEDYKQNTAQ
ncbi:MAG: glycine cleavage system protein GcvH [Candidatus Eremiobacteraeota bacterium]|nr:glycine cleavage system protein GcvH [Candidatus Eremiobacteraeota bacterium]